MGRRFYGCKDYENIENYNEALSDDFKGWVIHHRLETHDDSGNLRLNAISKDEMIKSNMYYNRPAKELIFMKKSEHNMLHNSFITDEIRNKLKSNLGKRFSEETRRKMSEANRHRKGLFKGRHWFTNGHENRFANECPEGFWRGRTNKENK